MSFETASSALMLKKRREGKRERRDVQCLDLGSAQRTKQRCHEHWRRWRARSGPRTSVLVSASETISILDSYSDTFLVALAYVMQKTPFVFPIVGGRKVEHLLSNIEALDISLSEDQITYLESILPFDVGFPNNFVVSRAL